MLRMCSVRLSSGVIDVVIDGESVLKERIFSLSNEPIRVHGNSEARKVAVWSEENVAALETGKEVVEVMNKRWDGRWRMGIILEFMVSDRFVMGTWTLLRLDCRA